METLRRSDRLILKSDTMSLLPTTTEPSHKGAHAMQDRPPLTIAAAIQTAERHAKATRRPYIVTERPRVFADTETNRALAKISGEAIIHTAPRDPSRK